MKELKGYTAIVSILLIGIGALRLLLLGEHYNISLWSYINFSNILAYTLDVVRGMIYYAPFVMVFIAFKSRISSGLFRVHICCYIVAVVLMLGVAYFWYKWIPLTRWGAFWLKYLLLFGFFFVGMTIKKWDRLVNPTRSFLSDFPMLVLVLSIIFLYWYLKIDFKFWVRWIDERKKFTKSMLVIKHSTTERDTIWTTATHYVILSTGDHIFLHNDSDNSTTVIPMTNVLSNTTNIGDTTNPP